MTSTTSNTHSSTAARLYAAIDSAAYSHQLARRAARTTADPRMRAAADALAQLLDQRARALAQHTHDGIAARRRLDQAALNGINQRRQA